MIRARFMRNSCVIRQSPDAPKMWSISRRTSTHKPNLCLICEWFVRNRLCDWPFRSAYCVCSYFGRTLTNKRTSVYLDKNASHLSKCKGYCSSASRQLSMHLRMQTLRWHCVSCILHIICIIIVSWEYTNLRGIRLYFCLGHISLLFIRNYFTIKM